MAPLGGAIRHYSGLPLQIFDKILYAAYKPRMPCRYTTLNWSIKSYICKSRVYIYNLTIINTLKYNGKDDRLQRRAVLGQDVWLSQEEVQF
jgi:hypothetical protein